MFSVYTNGANDHLEESSSMPSSQKSTKTSPENAPQAARTSERSEAQARVKPKSQQQVAKPSGSVAKPGSQDGKAADSEAPKAPERKTSAKLSTTKERASAGQTPAARPRKLTPQQQVHLARVRRRRLRERLGLGFIALLVVAVIAVVVWQVIVKNAASNQQANLHANATATAAVQATITENTLSPAVPPTITTAPTTTKDGLQYIDINVGNGQVVKTGDTIKVQYTGWFQATDVKFDSSYDDNANGQPTQFTLTADSVIKGWVEGLAGMKVGGMRRLIIPPALAYGANGQPPQIPPNATLIFDVQIVSIVPAGS